jgi:hypothetical protein
MANVSRINGFRPVKHVTGAPYNGQANVYAVLAADATALFVGDPVNLDGNAHTNGIASVTKATASGQVLGVVVGILPPKMDPVSGSMTSGSIALDTPQYRPASTFQYVLVCDAPDVIYEAEAATGANAAYTYLLADVGLNVGSTTVVGSTTTGTSGSCLDMSTKATTATLPWKILGASQRPDNETVSGTSTAVKLLVKINQAALGNGTGATGV